MDLSPPDPAEYVDYDGSWAEGMELGSKCVRRAQGTRRGGRDRVAQGCPRSAGLRRWFARCWVFYFLLFIYFFIYYFLFF